jgi:hypothetical protein
MGNSAPLFLIAARTRSRDSCNSRVGQADDVECRKSGGYIYLHFHHVAVHSDHRARFGFR